MALNPDQFNAFYEGAGRRDKRTVAGERLVRHTVLEQAGVPFYEPGTDASFESENNNLFVTADGYGIGKPTSRGISSVYTPDGRELAGVERHVEGMGEIRDHREGKHWTQKPQKPIGIPMTKKTGTRIRKVGEGN